MKISPRILTAVGFSTVLLALAFLILRAGVLGRPDTTGASASSAAGWAGNKKPERREHTKRSRSLRGMRSNDPEVQRRAEEWYQDLLTRHPEFQVKFRDVPDAENGFLQFLDLLDDLNSGNSTDTVLPIDDELRKMLYGMSPFDAARLNAWIARNPQLFQRILNIAEAPGQSVKGVPMERHHYFSADVPISMARLLQASAHAAMDRGDTTEALRFHRASLNLANHFDKTEIHSLLSETISLLTRASTSKNFHANILPGLLGNPDALAQWRETMPLPNRFNDTVPKLLTADWHVEMRMIILPTLISGESISLISGESNSKESPPLNTDEQRAVVESYTSQMSGYIRQAATMSVANLVDGSRAIIQQDPSVSPAGNEFLEILGTGSRAWLKGLGRQNSVDTQRDALLAIALGEPPPSEPITGEPFSWDPVTMTLSPPASLEPFGFKIEPLKLPAP